MKYTELQKEFGEEASQHSCRLCRGIDLAKQQTLYGFGRFNGKILMLCILLCQATAHSAQSVSLNTSVAQSTLIQDAPPSVQDTTSNDSRILVNSAAPAVVVDGEPVNLEGIIILAERPETPLATVSVNVTFVQPSAAANSQQFVVASGNQIEIGDNGEMSVPEFYIDTQFYTTPGRQVDIDKYIGHKLPENSTIKHPLLEYVQKFAIRAMLKNPDFRRVFPSDQAELSVVPLELSAGASKSFFASITIGNQHFIAKCGSDELAMEITKANKLRQTLLSNGWEEVSPGVVQFSQSSNNNTVFQYLYPFMYGSFDKEGVLVACTTNELSDDNFVCNIALRGDNSIQIMRIAPGKVLREIIRNVDIDDSLQKAASEAYLGMFQALQAGKAVHGDFHARNAFYKEANEQTPATFTIIDAGMEEDDISKLYANSLDFKFFHLIPIVEHCLKNIFSEIYASLHDDAKDKKLFASFFINYTFSETIKAQLNSFFSDRGPRKLCKDGICPPQKEMRNFILKRVWPLRLKNVWPGGNISEFVQQEDIPLDLNVDLESPHQIYEEGSQAFVEAEANLIVVMLKYDHIPEEYVEYMKRQLNFTGDDIFELKEKLELEEAQPAS